MSEPELQEDFLPRWQTHSHLDALSSSTTQAPQQTQATPYLYTGGVPPPPPQSGQQQRLQALQQSPTGGQSQSSRQPQPPRISQLLEQEQGSGFSGSSPYNNLSGHNQLNRSASLGGGASGATSSVRGRRQHHPPDDLEGAFHSDNQGLSSPRGSGQSQLQTSLYPSSVAYHQAQTLTSQHSGNSNTASPAAGDPYSDMYFNGSGAGHAPKRSQTQHDASTSVRSGRSPMRSNTSNQSLIDSYTQQSQYSPTTASSYAPYPPTSGSGALPPAPYHAHSRSHSQVKGEPMTPPIASAYTPGALNSTPYSPSYGMESSTSPVPPPPRQSSNSTPNTPFPYAHPSQSPGGGQYYQQDLMQVDAPQHKRRASGFKRVRDARDLRPYVNAQPGGRRMDASGTFLSPLKQLTTGILDTYHICNPQFRYESTHNPRRVLTKPSKPAHNEGYDNDDYDYILYVNDWLGTEEGHKYLILDILGQGTFGQVVKCQNMKTHEIVAVKVVKNKPAYFNQSMMEVTILELLNNQCDPQDEHHILRLRDSFIHRSHLCLVFELLSSNLYELIKQNQFQGLSTQLVKVFTAQLLDAMTILKDARLIHCDLKPENILLKSLQSPQIKVIDFGSACHERQTVYTYIQSRFYRSPEVLLGIPYTASIDMWSLGCIAVELFLGLPLFPGTSEYNQITRIVEMIGTPPTYMLDMGKQTNQFFDSYVDHYGQKKYRLKSLEQYSREHNTNEQPGKQYFKATSLPEIVNTAPMPTFKSSSRQGHEMEKELNNRASFIDFCQGLLNLNPIERWSPQQARMHPFITGEKFTRPFTPSNQVQQTVTPSTSASPGASSTSSDPKRPYGGLVPSQPKGTRAYQDAASYNHHLAQHQAYTAQAQAATQAANNAFRNPYITPQNSAPASTSAYSQDNTAPTYSSQQPPAQQQQPQQAYATVPNSQPAAGHRGLTHQSSAGQLNTYASGQQFPTHTSGGSGGLSVPSSMGPAPPSNAYAANSRNRANTINQMDTVPPALARLQHMTQDVIAGRNALTPVLNRDDAMREWERRQSGKAAAAQPYPQLEFLQQQAELASSGGLTNWAQQPAAAGRYQPPSSKLSHSYAPTIVVDEDRQNNVMQNVRSAARTEPASAYTSSTAIASPPQVYTGNSSRGGGAYAASNYPQQHTPTSPFDSLDRRTDIGNLFVPMQPDHYQAYGGSAPPSATLPPQGGQSRPPQNAAQAFYGSGVVPQGQLNNGQQRNVFAGGNNISSQGQMDDSSPWPR